MRELRVIARIVGLLYRLPPVIRVVLGLGCLVIAWSWLRRTGYAVDPGSREFNRMFTWGWAILGGSLVVPGLLSIGQAGNPRARLEGLKQLGRAGEASPEATRAASGAKTRKPPLSTRKF